MARSKKWSEKTDATLMTPDGFAGWCQGRVVVGVMGFSGAWRRSGLTGPALTDYVLDAEVALSRQLRLLKDEHGEKLVMCSGATDIGVPGLAYRLAAQRGITAAGITAGNAVRYRLGQMAALVVVGRRFGDESAVFVEACHTFLLLGGGPQSADECRRAAAAGKPITIIQGFGGVADAFTAADLPTAAFVDGRVVAD